MRAMFCFKREISRSMAALPEHGKLEHKANISQAASHSVLAVHTYLGGCRPGLLAHLSRFSITLSWLGRVVGFWSFAVRGVSLVIGILLPQLQNIPFHPSDQQITY
jgi:hypothetical protein